MLYMLSHAMAEKILLYDLCYSFGMCSPMMQIAPTLFFNLVATIPVAIPELTPTAKKSFLKIFYKQIVPINWLSFLKVISQ